MAVVDLLSAALTARDAGTKNNSILEMGMLRSASGWVETNDDDSIGATYRLCQVPSNAKISQLLIYTDGAGSAGDTDVGIYQTTKNGSAVVDADFFASALDINAAALNGVDITHESAVFGFEDIDKPLWSALGLSSDPNLMYDIVCTLTEAIATTASTLALKCKYVI